MTNRPTARKPLTDLAPGDIVVSGKARLHITGTARTYRRHSGGLGVEVPYRVMTGPELNLIGDETTGRTVALDWVEAVQS
jgi:hypothetical protein